MKQEYYEAMDQLAFTEEAKARMAKKFSQIEVPRKKRITLRKAAALSLAAAARERAAAFFMEIRFFLGASICEKFFAIRALASSVKASCSIAS